MFPSERLKGIDVFVCVAEAGSFTAAAQRLHLTTSAVSKAVARLEKRLQTRLFLRTTRHLALSEEGEAFYRTCTGVLNQLEEAELALHHQSQTLQGRIRIDLPVSYGRMHVLPAMLSFLERHPQLEPVITFSDRFVEPVEEGIDLLVRSGGSGIWPGAVDHHQLGIQRLILCAAPHYLSEYGMPQSEQALSQHRCVLYCRNDGNLTPLRLAGQRSALKHQRSVLALSDTEGMVMAAVAGHGIVQLPTWLVAQHLAQKTLVQVLPELSISGMPISLAWIKGRARLPKVSALRDWLIENLTPSLAE
ncbi:LysR family transcriptional regulator [Enterobacteriaceae bacterium 4M9]|nr:LysR family transcriptional regulator [Enterobacteriaceae bacterium 4M9]